MSAFGVSASDLALVLCQGFVGVALSVPFAALVAAARGGTSGTAARSRGRARRPADARHGRTEGKGHGGRAAGMERRSEAAPRPGPDDPYAVHLRRAIRVVRLFAAAPPGGEKEAAYHALVRIAAAADAARGPSPAGVPLTPGALYRDLTRGATWRMPGTGALAFDARVCAELDRRSGGTE